MQEYNGFDLQDELKKHSRRLINPCILASRSIRRKELLEELGLEVFVRPTNGEEVKKPLDNPLRIIRANSAIKMESFKRNYDESKVVYPIITADTVVAIDIENVKNIAPYGFTFVNNTSYILGKPKNKSEAFAMLSFLREAKVHRVYSSIYISFFNPLRFDTLTVCAEDCAILEFRNGVKDSDLKYYIESTDVTSAAGGYKIQENGDALFSAVYGDITTVEGLSYRALYSALQEMDTITI